MKIGIDFGTSFSLPAGMINGAPATLLPSGEYGIPSVFYYDEDLGVQIGKVAENYGDLRSDNVKRDIKMEIKTHDDSFVVGGKAFSKKQIIGHIFKEIARISCRECETRALSSQSIDGVVVSVPAEFEDREKRYIKESVEALESNGGAALKVLRLIPEPVAAAIAYFSAPAVEDEKTILVYDLGGGTCDTAIVRANRKSDYWYDVLGVGMERIGGRDWDRVLINMIKRKYQEKSGNISFDAETENSIRKQAIETKHILSECATAIASVNIRGKTHSCYISIEEFEKASSEILQSTMKLVRKMVEKCITKGKIDDLDDIDYIVCVGGSSNMPQVKKAFEKAYPKIPIKTYQPAAAIAFGAAIYAEHLTEAQYLRDICKFSYGIEVLDQWHRYYDENRTKISNLIKQGSQLPISAKITTVPIKDNQTSTRINIFESECTDDYYLPERGTEIGHVQIFDLVDHTTQDETLTTMKIDQSGLLHVEALDKKTGKKEEIEIQIKTF
ncbi:MAG: Hsp70 family protein [Clostridiales Family XIII bacterium]|jgi:molecular chaperone DnaK (HSP70)|nr:Hsp70 family protein [Clostridiales Family XIII bacterium]